MWIDEAVEDIRERLSDRNLREISKKSGLDYQRLTRFKRLGAYMPIEDLAKLQRYLFEVPAA